MPDDVHYKFQNLCNRIAGTANDWHPIELDEEGVESSAVLNTHVPEMYPIWRANVQHEIKVINADAKQTAVRTH